MAYGAVISLLQTLKSLSEVLPEIHPEKQQIESLYNGVYFLQVFLEDMEKDGHDHRVAKVKSLERRIRNLAYMAEDEIESHLYGFYLPEPREEQVESCLSIEKSLQRIIREVDSIKKEVGTIYDQISGVRIFQPASSPVKDLSRKAPVLGESDTIVGRDEDIERILDELTSLSKKLNIIPIVGMGGIGKTTLARRVYDDPLIVHHFYVRAWFTVTQQYQAKEMLLGLLNCVASNSDECFDEKKTAHEKLAEKLYRSLKGRRYIIVMDDIWSKEAWDGIKRSFPDDNNGSRVIITTRLTAIGVHVRPNRTPHQVSILNSDDSWKLLHDKVFHNQSCPAMLVDVGKRIAEQCRGLPLAIHVVAGFLSKIEKAWGFWFKVANSLTSIVTKTRNQCLRILGLSYNYLPQHLKACFLYLGVFPEDSEIPVWRLIRLWVAEGILQPVTDKSMEDVAEECLDDLIDRNLVMARQKSSDGKIKTCSIHDLLHYLSLREAQSEGFLHSMKYSSSLSLAVAKTSRRLSFQSGVSGHPDDHNFSRPSMPFTRSFFIWGRHKYHYTSTSRSLLNHIEFKLLRVLDITFTHFRYFPLEIVQLVQLKYLALTTLSNLPTTISKLQCLQTLILDSGFKTSTFPREIWNLPNLRHIHSKSGCYLPDPPKAESEAEIPVVLQNLQTISRITLSSCTENVLTSIPDLRKLGVYETKHDYDSRAELSISFTYLAYLQKLEKLKIHLNSVNQHLRWIPSLYAFPQRLKKLTLAWTCLPWDYMATLGMLPNLEVLKLRNYAFKGKDWEPIDEGFCKLKVLQLHCLDLVQWNANKFHFPSLQKLVLRFCFHLKEIPLGIGDIETLEIIELDDSSPSAVISAKQIQEQQKSQGNDELEVHIYCA